ncbi:MAG TPA: hypothetical protein VLM38_02400 [Blastocatellia bacterium]|nr:hypothetical protein [Blastocatellia bacterium]
MKRTLTFLFGITLLLVFACARRANVNPTPSQPPDASQGAAANEKEVKLTIATVNGKCVIVDPGDVLLSVNKDKIKWCIEYSCSLGTTVIVIVDDFKNEKSGPATFRNPFGNHSDRDNTFDFGPFSTAGSDCTKVSGLATVKGHYFYRILVLKAADGQVLASLDPGVIIGN